MQLTPEQVKGRIKNVAKENKADARTQVEETTEGDVPSFRFNLSDGTS